jgi:CheY-like chemotaxis protein
MRPLNCIWFEDKADYAAKLEEQTIKPLCDQLEIGFMGVRFDDESGLSEFSKGILLDLVLVDHNLIGTTTGDQIITKIREHEHNSDVEIIYYSTNTQVVELQKLVEKYPGIIIIHRNDLPSYLVRFLKNF